MQAWKLEDWLMHHGVKGQKWGVRRTPEQLRHKPSIKEVLEKSLSRGTIVQDAIRSGEVSKTINREKQMRHTMSGHPPGRSYLYGGLEFSQRLVDELSGTGEPKLDSHGNWTHKELVKASRVIGAHIDSDGRETETNAAMIVYSNTGSHIYPRKENK